jgi:hypothetical protein
VARRPPSGRARAKKGTPRAGVVEFPRQPARSSSATGESSSATPGVVIDLIEGGTRYIRRLEDRLRAAEDRAAKELIRDVDDIDAPALEAAIKFATAHGAKEAITPSVMRRAVARYLDVRLTAVEWLIAFQFEAQIGRRGEG